MEEKTTQKDPQSVSSKEVTEIIEQKTKKISKIKPLWIIVIIVIIILFCCLIGFFLLNKSQSPKSTSTIPSPTSNPMKTTAKLKTYTNSKYNYSIDYPDNWRYRESPDTKSGAAFSPLSKPNEYENETINISGGNKTLGYDNLSFEEYAKIAATKEIQNYNKLSSIKKITTKDGTIGYTTTWIVQSLGGGGSSESLPITYFESPNDKNTLIRVSLDNADDLNTYNIMLSTFKFTTTAMQDQKNNVLKIPEYGVQISLSDEISDAYIVKKDGYIYLKVHSLDSEPQCKNDDTSIAALSKENKDEINPMTNEKYSANPGSTTIDEYTYDIGLAQYSCAESAAGQTKLSNVRSAFTNATISKLQ